MILIDPGHSGRSIRSTDKKTKLRDIDYPNYPEIYETFDVSSCVAQGLRRDGYRVVLTKKKALSSVSLRKRARLANKVKAALAISVHDDHSQTAGFQATYSQRGVKKHGRYPTMYRGKGSHRTVFKLPKVAKASEKAATIMAKARTRAQGRKVTVRQNSFSGRPPLEPGNLALVQLLTSRPWVYHELGAKTKGSTTRAISIKAELRYARGLLVGIERAVPISGRVVPQPSAGARGLRSCLVRQVKQDRPERYLPDGW